MQVILVAHDPDESAVLALAIQRAGMTLSRSVNFERVLKSWPSQPAEMIVLAVDGEAGLEQIRRLRGQTTVPIVLVTDPVAEAMHVALLDAGTDLVVMRPFSARLLIAKLRMLARRAAGVALSTLPTLGAEAFTLDPATRTVQVLSGPPKRLTQLEFRLLYTLMIHRGQVMSSDKLVEYVWGYEGDADRDLVRGLVSRLRAKVEPNSREPRFVVTVPGVGYTFELADDEDDELT